MPRRKADAPKRKYAQRKQATPSEDSLPGRIDLMLGKLGRTRQDLERDTGITKHTMQALTRGARSTLRPQSLAAAAEYLGVEPGWLKDGPEKAPSAAPAPSAIVPAAPAPAARQNGATRLNGGSSSHQVKVEAAMRGNLHNAMSSLWGLMPIDVQVMIVSKMAELLAQRAQHQ